MSNPIVVRSASLGEGCMRKMGDNNVFTWRIGDKNTERASFVVHLPEYVDMTTISASCSSCVFGAQGHSIHFAGNKAFTAEVYAPKGVEEGGSCGFFGFDLWVYGIFGMVAAGLCGLIFLLRYKYNKIND